MSSLGANYVRKIDSQASESIFILLIASIEVLNFMFNIKNIWKIFAYQKTIKKKYHFWIFSLFIIIATIRSILIKKIQKNVLSDASPFCAIINLRIRRRQRQTHKKKKYFILQTTPILIEISNGKLKWKIYGQSHFVTRHVKLIFLFIK